MRGWLRGVLGPIRELLCLAFIGFMYVQILSAVTYMAFEQITVGATAVGFTATKLQPNGAGTDPQATIATCRNESGSVPAAVLRWTIDGTTPSTTVGTQLLAGEILTLTGNDVLQKFRAIEQDGQPSKLSCFYMRP